MPTGRTMAPSLGLARQTVRSMWTGAHRAVPEVRAKLLVGSPSPAHALYAYATCRFKSNQNGMRYKRRFCRNCGTHLINEILMDDTRFRVTFPATYNTHPSELPPSWRPRFHNECQEAVVDVTQWMDGLPKYRDLPSELGGSGAVMEQSDADRARQEATLTSQADEIRALRARLAQLAAPTQADGAERAGGPDNAAEPGEAVPSWPTARSLRAEEAQKRLCSSLEDVNMKLRSGLAKHRSRGQRRAATSAPVSSGRAGSASAREHTMTTTSSSHHPPARATTARQQIIPAGPTATTSDVSESRSDLPSGQEQHRDSGNSSTPQKLFARADRNGDGRLTRAELILQLREDQELAKALHLPRRVGDGERDAFEAVFQRIDQDDDRSITAEEFAASFRSAENSASRSDAQRTVANEPTAGTPPPAAVVPRETLELLTAAVKGETSGLAERIEQIAESIAAMQPWNQQQLYDEQLQLLATASYQDVDPVSEDGDAYEDEAENSKSRERRSNFMRTALLVPDKDVVMNELKHVTTWSPQSSVEFEAAPHDTAAAAGATGDGVARNEDMLADAVTTAQPEPEPEPEAEPEPE